MSRRLSPEEVLDRPWLYLDMTTRIYNVLAFMNLGTVRDVCRLKKKDLLKRKHFGMVSLQELTDELQGYGLELGRDYGIEHSNALKQYGYWAGDEAE